MEGDGAHLRDGANRQEHVAHRAQRVGTATGNHVRAPARRAQFVGQPDQGTQPQEAFEDLDSPVGLLASYYNAINLQDYQRAYNYWETPLEPFDEFAAGFADTASVQVIVQPPTRVSGAAGSSYVEIPTVLIAHHHDGAEKMYVGCFVTRTSNLQPPDIPQEDVWHLYGADVTEVPTDSSIPALLGEACPGG